MQAAQLSLTNRPSPDLPEFATFTYTPLPFDALNEEDPIELSDLYLAR